MFEAKGRSGQVSFDGDFVTISRKGFLARATVGKGDKRIPVAHITGVQWKPAGPMVNGFIQFTVPGGKEVKSSFGSQTTSAGRDENSVIFTRKQEPAFAQLRSAIERALAARQHPPSAASRIGGSVADELAKLQALLEQGVLSQQEFQQQKTRLLG